MIRSAINFALFILFLIIGWIASLVVVSFQFIRRLVSSLFLKNNDNESNKLVIVTGADHGIGRMTVDLLFATTKFQILALTLTDDAAKDISSMAQNLQKQDNSTEKASASPRLTGFKCNVTSDEDVANMIKYISNKLQESNNDSNDLYVYGLINNAGISSPGMLPWYNNIDPYYKVMDVNYFGTVRITKAILPFMMPTTNDNNNNIHTNKQRRIINISSVAGSFASGANSTYDASKFAVEAFSDGIRMELKPFNIHVTKVRPSGLSSQIKDSHFKGLLNCFNNAPTNVQSLYGGEEYSKQLVEATEKLKENFEPVSLATTTLRDILLSAQPPKPYYMVGSAAQTMAKVIPMLPYEIQDFLISSSLPAPVMPSNA